MARCAKCSKKIRYETHHFSGKRVAFNLDNGAQHSLVCGKIADLRKKAENKGLRFAASGV